MVQKGSNKKLIDPQQTIFKPFNKLAVHVVLSSFKFEAHSCSFFNVEGASERKD